MSLGLPEIIFSLTMFGIIWFLIYYVKIKIESKKPKVNIVEKLEKQEDKEFLIKGRVVSLGKRVEEKPKKEQKVKEIEKKPEVKKKIKKTPKKKKPVKKEIKKTPKKKK